MNNELQLLELKRPDREKGRVDIEKQQRDYFLNQQLKTIQEELRQNPQEEEVKKLELRSRERNGKRGRAHFEKELRRIRRMNPQVAEYSIQLNYLELMLDFPWNKSPRIISSSKGENSSG